MLENTAARHRGREPGILLTSHSEKCGKNMSKHYGKEGSR